MPQCNAVAAMQIVVGFGSIVYFLFLFPELSSGSLPPVSLAHSGLYTGGVVSGRSVQYHQGQVSIVFYFISSAAEKGSRHQDGFAFFIVGGLYLRIRLARGVNSFL